eukprot:IDg1428t1
MLEFYKWELYQSFPEIIVLADLSDSGKQHLLTLGDGTVLF